jgi:3-hydroxyisobutyrate dehydrogenase-like beta-hydroxyacid dehydrogenase
VEVGFAGLGRMGQHMVRNLIGAGHEMTVWNRSAEKAHNLATEVGCTVAHTPAAQAAATQVVVTMLATILHPRPSIRGLMACSQSGAPGHSFQCAR